MTLSRLHGAGEAARVYGLEVDSGAFQRCGQEVFFPVCGADFTDHRVNIHDFTVPHFSGFGGEGGAVRWGWVDYRQQESFLISYNDENDFQIQYCFRLFYADA